MKLNQQLLKINRNFLICFLVSATGSAIFVQLLSDVENYLNTTFTIVFGYGIFFGIFFVLFYFDNKTRYKQMKRNLIKKELIKLISSFGIGSNGMCFASPLGEYTENPFRTRSTTFRVSTPVDWRMLSRSPSTGHAITAMKMGIMALTRVVLVAVVV